jgi:hypothetical protein
MRAAQASSPRSGPVGFRPSERLLDANAKRRYLAAKRIDLRVQIRALDTPDHLVERPFKSLQDGYDKKRVEHHR